MDASLEAATLSREAVQERLGTIRERIARYRSPDEVTIICVTKTFPTGIVELVRDCGLVDVGENYYQEMQQKEQEIDGVSWHFIGGLQRNKLKGIARIATAIHSISTTAELDLLSTVAYSGGLFVQLRSDGGPQRSGASLEDVPRLVEYGRTRGLSILGLMGVAPIPQDGGAVDYFRLVRRLSSSLGLEMCSMGMSEDFEVAVSEGATHVRLGRALLGSRPPKS